MSSLRPVLDRSYSELSVELDPELRIFWTWMDFKSRPTFNWTFMREVLEVQTALVNGGSDDDAIAFHVLGSKVPGAYCYGGDLEKFVQLIKARDARGMRDYAQMAIDVMWGNSAYASRCGAISIGLVEGDALGGGFEAALSCDVVFAEEGTKFGLPEIMFNLFPGMGAYSFLTRRIGSVEAERMILGNEGYTAEDLHALGLVHAVVPKGEGRAAIERYARQKLSAGIESVRAEAADLAAKAAPYEELRDVVMIWADAAISLPDRDVRTMERLVSAQYRAIAKKELTNS